MRNPFTAFPNQRRRGLTDDERRVVEHSENLGALIALAEVTGNRGLRAVAIARAKDVQRGGRGLFRAGKPPGNSRGG